MCASPDEEGHRPPRPPQGGEQPDQDRIRSTFTEVFIPSGSFGQVSRRCPRSADQEKAHQPHQQGQNWGSPMTIQQATQARNTPNAAKRSTFFSPFIPLRPRWDTFSSRNTTIVPCRRSARSPPQGCQSRCVPPVCRHYSIFSLQCHPVFQHGPSISFSSCPPFLFQKRYGIINSQSIWTILFFGAGPLSDHFVVRLPLPGIVPMPLAYWTH